MTDLRQAQGERILECGMSGDFGSKAEILA